MPIPQVKVPPLNTFSLFQAGGTALQQVPGLKRAAAKGFVINLLIYFVLVTVASLAFYRLVHLPLAQWVTGLESDWLQLPLHIGLWVLQITAFFVAALLSIRISLKFMGVWYADLAALVVGFHRGTIKLPSFLEELPHTLREVGREILISMGLILIGFVPVLGPLTVFSIGAWLQGRSITQPYTDVIRGAKLGLHQETQAQKLFLGSGQMLLAIIPLIGWMLLPVVNLFQVLGYAWIKELSEQVAAARDEQPEAPTPQPPPPPQPEETTTDAAATSGP
ncbi:EI24 domain-containing protein [Acanthopleuribacter pedis]|uniref:EI24 domain-containing protein n=1 Tax=Acanthopleuribacter pedis TaxID=442870 RepID=A0A8J7Q773_9BACT|nr:EI24 domain-containing protein [Acanthopleuribacter pedis]MBO1321877.1 EI24 domain-containing protein [Acanthopleuribacter pedis]